MSVIKEGAYVVPSRVLGLFKYLKSTKKFKDKRENIYNLLSPTELIRKDEDKDVRRNMLQTVILESKKMGLLVEEDDEISIHPDLVDIDEKSLPSAIANLFFSSENTENHDFGKVCSWYLAQDFRDAPSNWDEAAKKLEEQVGAGILNLNGNRYGLFEYWSCYLGFSWQHTKKGFSCVTVPDPTKYLKQNLGLFFKDEKKKEFPIIEFMDQLAKHAPVFEFGLFRNEMEQQMEGIVRDPNTLSPVTSMSLFRLQEANFVKLSKESDADVLVVSDGETEERISHIKLLEA